MLFRQQTEQQITNNIGIANYGGLVTLTADAYLEILRAARNWQASQQCVSRWQPEVAGRVIGSFQDYELKPMVHEYKPKEGNDNVQVSG